MCWIVVIGMGMINLLGLNKEDFFLVIVKGECGIKYIESFDVSVFFVCIVGEIIDFDFIEVMNFKDVKKVGCFI